jgi:hypothetical protein
MAAQFIIRHVTLGQIFMSSTTYPQFYIFLLVIFTISKQRGKLHVSKSMPATLARSRLQLINRFDQRKKKLMSCLIYIYANGTLKLCTLHARLIKWYKIVKKHLLYSSVTREGPQGPREFTFASTSDQNFKAMLGNNYMTQKKECFLHTKYIPCLRTFVAYD